MATRCPNGRWPAWGKGGSIKIRSRWPWPSAPTAGSWPRRGTTAGAAFGRPAAAASCASCPVTVPVAGPWRFRPTKLLSRLEGEAGEVHGLAFAPDGRSLVATGADQVIRVWASATGVERRKWKAGGPAHTLGGVALGPDGRTAVVCRDKVQVWDLMTGEVVRRLDIPAADSALSADGKLLATASHSATLALWELATDREVIPLARHTRWGGERLAFAPDGKTVASGGADANIFLWERATGRVIRRLGAAGRLLSSSPPFRGPFRPGSPDGAHLRKVRSFRDPLRFLGAR